MGPFYEEIIKMYATLKVNNYRSNDGALQEETKVELKSSISLKIVYLGMIFLVFMWGLTFPAGREVATSQMGHYPLIITFFRYLYAIPMLVVFAKSIDGKISLPKEHTKQIFILGILQISLYQFFFISGLRYTSSSDAVMILNPTISLFTAIFATKMYIDEKLTLNRFIGIIFAFVGVSLIFANSPNPDVENRLLGNSFIVMTALTYATYAVFARPLFQKIPILTFQLWATIFGWLVICIFASIEFYYAEPFSISTEVMLWILYLGFAAAAGNAIMSLGIKNIGPTKAAVFINFIPLAGVIMSNLVIGENFSIWYLLAFITISFGVYLVNRKPQT